MFQHCYRPYMANNFQTIVKTWISCMQGSVKAKQKFQPFPLAILLQFVPMHIMWLLLRINDGNQFPIIFTDRCLKQKNENWTVNFSFTKSALIFFDDWVRLYWVRSDYQNNNLSQLAWKLVQDLTSFWDSKNKRQRLITFINLASFRTKSQRTWQISDITLHRLSLIANSTWSCWPFLTIGKRLPDKAVQFWWKCAIPGTIPYRIL